MTCPNCKNTEFEDGAKFCRICGTPIPTKCKGCMFAQLRPEIQQSRCMVLKRIVPAIIVLTSDRPDWCPYEKQYGNKK